MVSTKLWTVAATLTSPLYSGLCLLGCAWLVVEDNLPRMEIIILVSRSLRGRNVMLLCFIMFQSFPCASGHFKMRRGSCSEKLSALRDAQCRPEPLLRLYRAVSFSDIVRCTGDAALLTSMTSLSIYDGLRACHGELIGIFHGISGPPSGLKPESGGVRRVTLFA